MASYTLAFLCIEIIYLTTAYPFYRDRIPNGFNVPNPCNPTLTWDGVGHKQMAGGGLRNPFGEDYAVYGRVWGRELCELDSDLDGRTNGEELGDPGCTWTPGDVPLSANLSHPGVCEPVESDRCKNGPYKYSCRGGIDDKSCPGINGSHVDTMNVTFPVTPVPAKATSYFCKRFRLADEKAIHAIAFEPIIDNANVLHHIALFGCRTDFVGSPENDPPVECGMTIYGCRDMIQVWSLGMDGYCLKEDVGVPFGKGTFNYVAMQLHWTNPELRSDWTV